MHGLYEHPHPTLPPPPTTHNEFDVCFSALYLHKNKEFSQRKGCDTCGRCSCVFLHFDVTFILVVNLWFFSNIPFKKDHSCLFLIFLLKCIMNCVFFSEIIFVPRTFMLDYWFQDSVPLIHVIGSIHFIDSELYFHQHSDIKLFLFIVFKLHIYRYLCSHIYCIAISNKSICSIC